MSEQATGVWTARQFGLEFECETSKAKCFKFSVSHAGQTFPILIWIPTKFFRPGPDQEVWSWAIGQVKTKIAKAAWTFKREYERGLYGNSNRAC